MLLHMAVIQKVQRNIMKIGIKGKKCVCCGRWWPLFLYQKDVRKFQLPIALGKVRCCRICVCREQDPVVRWRNDKFILLTRTKWEKIREFFRQ